MKQKTPKTRTAAEVNRELLHNERYSLKYYICSGFKETFEALWALVKFDLAEFELELQQLAFGVQMMYHQYSGEDFELNFCADTVQEYYDRRVVWLSLFDLFDIEFNVAYMVHGTNFRKPSKIQKALALAGKQIPDVQARILARKYAMSLSNSKRLGLLD
jgi:hypothetical protein